MDADFEVPTRGWNARDNMDAMEPGFALTMVNQVPENGFVRSRGGTQLYQDESVAAALGASGSLETLAVFDAGGTQQLVAARGNKIFTVDDETTATQIGTGFTSARWQTIMANGRLLMCNGADDPQEFDGTTLSAISLTMKDALGVAIPGNPIDTLIGCVSHQNRVFYWADNEQRFFYCDVAGGYTGDIIEFPIETRADRGGYVVSIMSFSRDTGSGMDDMLVVHMSTGQALVYAGEDPGTAQNWQEVNRYNIGKPISVRGNTRFGGDQVIITYDGFQNLTTALPNQNFSKGGNVGDLIVNAVKTAANDYSSNYGWEVTFFPRFGWLMFNVPRSATRFDQYILNTVTGAWFRATRMEGVTWTVWNDRLFYGNTDGDLMEAEKGAYDQVGTAKNPVKWRILTGYSKLGIMSRSKEATGTSITHNYGRGEYLDIEVLTDYERGSSYELSVPPEINAAVWGVGSWGVDSWASASNTLEAETRRDNFPADGVGTSLALKVRGMSKLQQITIYDLSLKYRDGGEI